MVGLLLTISMPGWTNEADFKLAATLWREFNLPVPPIGSVPVIANKGREKVIAFQDSKTRSLYIGSRIVKPYGYWVQRLGWKLPPTNVASLAGPLNKFRENPMISVAVQSYLLGRADYSSSLASRIEVPKTAWESSWIACVKDNSLSSHTALLAAVKLMNSHCETGSNTATTLEKVKALHKYRLLIPGEFSDPRGLQKLIADLEVTVNQQHKKQTQPERLIDAQIERTQPYQGSYARRPRFKSELPTELLKLGMEAVPALIEETKTQRLTRVFRRSEMSGWCEIVSSAEIARDTIVAISGGEVSEYEDPLIYAEWMEAKKEGRVPDWLLGRVVGGPQFQGINFDATNALIRSHPKLLPKALLKLRKAGSPPEALRMLLDSVKGSKKETQSLATSIAQSQKVEDAYGSLAILYKYNRNEFDAMLIKFLSVPMAHDEERGNADESYYCELAQFVHGTNNSRAWDQLEWAVKAGDPMIRANLLLYLSLGGRPIQKPANVKRTINIARKYFEDVSRPPYVEMPFGMHANWTLTKADDPTVGDIAIATVAYVTGVWTHPYDRLSKAEWAAVKKKVLAGDYTPFTRVPTK